MDRTVNSVTYKGSIPDAINQSRREKKLFVVYISGGEDEASRSLEQSMLVNEYVVELIGRCCIFLHLRQGNIDASQFSDIYPQKSVPSISVIGLNGVLLWYHEGHISSENMKERIEKAWAALHLHETAATLSLISRNAESVNATSSTLAQGGSSENPSASSNQSSLISGSSGVAHSTDLVSCSTRHDEPIEVNRKEDSNSDSDTGDKIVEMLELTCAEVQCDLPDSISNSVMGSSTDLKGKDITVSPKRNNKVDESGTTVPSEAKATPRAITTRGVSTQLVVNQDKAISSSAPDEQISNSVKSDDIQLSIRMPSGNRLEIKLTKQDVLRKVKNFVDENQGNGIGSYDLSLVYPKRVFTEQDMEATLYELGIQNRHALIVIPHWQSVQVSRPQPSPPSYDVDGNSGGGGYFGYLRTALSYVNPLSYLSGSPTSSNPEQLAHEGSQQHRSSSGQWNPSGMEAASARRPLPSNKEQDTTNENSGNTLRRRARPFGANVHTLGRDDASSSDERNTFWNGNSTEFGGDERK